MKTIALMARVNGGFERVPTTNSKGKPINPVCPANATRFYLRYVRDGKQVMEPAGNNFDQAVHTLRNREVAAEYEARGLQVPTTVTTDGRLTIANAAEQFYSNMEALDKSPSTRYAYKRAVDQFKANCRKVYLDEVTRQDVLDHIVWIRTNVPTRGIGQQNGTIRNRLLCLTRFFSQYEKPLPLKRREWPKTEERPVEAYTPEQLTQLFSQATIDEHDLILFLVCTGFRDDEVAHATYTDVNVKTHEVTVGPKPELGFTTKNGKVRVVPVPAELVDRMVERRQRNPEGVLIFPNSKGSVDACLLSRVRSAAKRAGYVGRVTLHKFRKTFGTRYAEKHGVMNAKDLLGHASIVTTQKYLAATKIAKGAVENLFEDVTKVKPAAKVRAIR